MKMKLFCAAIFLCAVSSAYSQGVIGTPEYVKELTSEWQGERLDDGRPKVSDALLKRLKNIQIEEAWGYLRSKGYHSQYEGEWEILHPEDAMTGRVLTAQYMPLRPDFKNLVKMKGAAENRDTIGGSNSWPIEILKPGDIYVADGYNKVVDGTLIGSNLGNAIYANSNNGYIFYGGVRDVAGLLDIEGFNGFHKGSDPSFIKDQMLTSINMPIRVGRASVLPGDVVLANQHGTIFIPAHLVERLVLSSEVVGLRDKFGFQRLREKTYTPGQIDTKWTDAIKADFLKWLKNFPDAELPMTRQELNTYLKESERYRTW